MIRTIVIAIVALVLVAMISLFVAARLAKKPGTVAVESGVLAHCPDSPNCVSSLLDEEISHRVDPIAAPGGAATLARAAGVLRAMPRTRIVTERPGYVHAECRSAFFGFVDDLELLVDESEGVIQVRSMARVGYSDFGVNRKRVEALRATLAATP